MKLFAVLLSCLTISGYSQDYLVTNRGDTLHGELKPMSYDQIDRIQVAENKKKTRLTALQVMEYSYKGDTYRPVQRDNTIRFMKLLKDGYLSLYAFRIENLTSFDGRLLSKKNGTKIEVPNLNFKKILANFLDDCNSVQAKLNNGDYGRKDIEKIIDDYNACLGTKSETIKKEDVTTVEGNQKSLTLENFKKRVEGLDNFPSKKDAVDLINDMIAKLKAGQPVPNYQTEVLKGFFQGNDVVKDDLEKVLTAIK